MPATRAGILVAYFGERCDVRSLGADDVAAYTKARQAGGIVVSTGGRRRRCDRGRRSADLTVVHRMLNWARTVRVQRRAAPGREPARRLRAGERPQPPTPRGDLGPIHRHPRCHAGRCGRQQ